MPALPPTSEVFRDAASRFATGITVVTCVDPDGVDHAMTASSFVALSLEPLLVSVCVEKASRFHEAIRRASGWAVSVLGSEDEVAARWFATRGRPLEHQLGRLAHHRGPHTGAAVADAALSVLECRTWASYPAGDHDLVVGEVVGVELPVPSAAPLVYFRRGFRELRGSVDD
jgi:flavin reductase (DIM6/NTAB) family NADH-FMN oxidoreductase RutF